MQFCANNHRKIFNKGLKLGLGFILFISGYCTWAQVADFNELRNRIGAEQIDTQRVNLLNSLATEYLQQDPDSALEILKRGWKLGDEVGFLRGGMKLYHTAAKAFLFKKEVDSTRFYNKLSAKLAYKLQDHEYLIESHIVSAAAFDLINQKDSSLIFLNQALDLATAQHFRESEARVLNRIAVTHMYQAEYDRARSYFLNAISLFKEIGDSNSVAGVLYNLGNNTSRAKNMELGLEYYEESYLYFKSLGNAKKQALVLSLIAYSNFQLSYYNRAFDYYQKSIATMDSVNIDDYKAICYKGLGEVFEAMDNVEKAIENYEASIQYSSGVYVSTERQSENDRILAKFKNLERYFEEEDLFYQLTVLKARMTIFQPITIFNALGTLYLKADQLDSAEYYFLRSKVLAEDEMNFHYEAQANIGLGKINSQRNAPLAAIAYLKRAIDAAAFSGYRQDELEARKTIYLSYKAIENTAMALDNFEKAEVLEDSLYSIKNAQKLTWLESTYQFENEKAEIVFENQKKLEGQKNISRLVGAGLLISLIIIIGIALFYKSKRQANLALQKTNSRILEQQAELQELNQAKTHFFTNISHEFRTPLTVIGGLAENIIREPTGNHLNEGKLIARNGKSLLRLINQILDLRKLETGYLKVDYCQTDIVQYSSYLMESFDSLANKKGVRLKFVSNEESLTMAVDQDKYLHILSNLISNALKFTEREGLITVSLVVNDKLNVSVTDTGIGIKTEYLSNVFNQFYQVDDSIFKDEVGTGIGLTLTKQLVELMEGEISVSSIPGKGSRFEFNLPIKQIATVIEDDYPEIDLPIEEENQALIKPQGIADDEEKETVLIVEDHQDITIYLQSLLGPQYNIKVADNGKDGIRLALEHIPDVIISDVMMPVKDGFELCQALKTDEKTSHIPIILLTAKADIESRLEGLNHGADAYLNKPFNQEELQIVLKNILKARKALHQRYINLGLLEQNETTTAEDGFIMKLRDLLHENISDSDFKVPSLCAAAGVSRTQLHNKIKALTGHSITNFINKVRIEKASELIKTSDLNIQEICWEVGYNSQSHFYKCFADIHGVTPKDYKNKTTGQS